MQYHDSQFQESNQDFAALAEINALMAERDYPEDDIIQFNQKAVRLLDKCADQFGIGTKFRYTIGKHFGRVRLRIIFMSPLNPPMLEECNTIDSDSEFVTHLFMNENSPFVSYRKRFRTRSSLPCIRR